MRHETLLDLITTAMERRRQSRPSRPSRPESRLTTKTTRPTTLRSAKLRKGLRKLRSNGSSSPCAGAFIGLAKMQASVIIWDLETMPDLAEVAAEGSETSARN